MEPVDEILARLGKSRFRAKFHLGKSERAYAEKLGLEGLQKHAEDFITARLAPAHPKNDGRQTPYGKHPVFIAQHATATCCRNCLARWHKIPSGRALTEEEIKAIVSLLLAWIESDLKRVY